MKPARVDIRCSIALNCPARHQNANHSEVDNASSAFASPPTLKAVLDRYEGIGPGFDLLRVGLAVAIFYGHAKYIAGSSTGPDMVAAALAQKGMAMDAARAAAFDTSIWGSFKRSYHLALVPIFFALSGFLVAGSAFRVRALKQFMAFRILRIFPTLTTEVTLSALVLGPLFTSYSLLEYCTDPKFVGTSAISSASSTCFCQEYSKLILFREW
ncbi:hypothetical protein [Bradyrhizobium sp. B117]|uniref:hypothetical protein n=1 Tax=Bradyrhizobium sp. B117 TaxID=3140246 RepID=UPI0031841804